MKFIFQVLKFMGSDQCLLLHSVHFMTLFSSSLCFYLTYFTLFFNETFPRSGLESELIMLNSTACHPLFISEASVMNERIIPNRKHWAIAIPLISAICKDQLSFFSAVALNTIINAMSGVRRDPFVCLADSPCPALVGSWDGARV